MAGARRRKQNRPMLDPIANTFSSGPRRRARLCLGALAIATWITSCGAQQRAAEKLIDPRLRSVGVLVERHGRALALGRYRVEQLSVEDEPFDHSGPLAADARGRTRPTQQLRLRFILAGGSTPWSVECIGQRRQPPDHDLAAVADEGGRDEIAVHCQLAGGEQRWVLRLDGTLASNLVGELVLAGGGGGTDASTAKPVELLLWHQPWSIARRRLPASLALIRSAGGGAEAALILDTPERAWLAPELDDRERELALAALLALHSLPLGFDG
jgi:hypothetical protein